MANKHPNTSGLKPFNKMEPEQAKYIQRLGGLAHAKQYSAAEDNQLALEAAKSYVAKQYPDGYDPVQNIYIKLYECAFDPEQPLKERLTALHEIQKIENTYNKYKDVQNALLYKCASPDYQMSDNYDTCFNDKDIGFIAEDDIAFADRIDRIVKEEQEYAKGLETKNSESCSDTNVDVQ